MIAIYTFQKIQIGSFTAITNGLLKLTLINSKKPTLTSYRLQYLSSPLSFLNFAAFFCNSLGA